MPKAVVHNPYFDWGNDRPPGHSPQAYYRLVADNRRFYYDTTGTGNSLNVRHPHTLQLIMDSLATG